MAAIVIHGEKFTGNLRDWKNDKTEIVTDDTRLEEVMDTSMQEVLRRSDSVPEQARIGSKGLRGSQEYRWVTTVLHEKITHTARTDTQRPHNTHTHTHTVRPPDVEAPVTVPFHASAVTLMAF
jgi:hypothetical protein